MIMVKIKNVKKHKKCVIKWKLKFQDYKHCLEATQFEKKKTRTNQLEKNNVDIDRLRENHEEYIKRNKLILKWQ